MTTQGRTFTNRPSHAPNFRATVFPRAGFLYPVALLAASRPEVTAPVGKFLQFIRKLRLPKCRICNKPVEFEIAKTDENGKAVHEECYAARVRLKAITPPPKAS